MAPTRSSRTSGADTDTSMAEASDQFRELAVDPMVCLVPVPDFRMLDGIEVYLLLLTTED